MDEKLITDTARAIARVFLTTDCMDLSERDYEEDFVRNFRMYRRMALAALHCLKEAP